MFPKPLGSHGGHPRSRWLSQTATTCSITPSPSGSAGRGWKEVLVRVEWHERFFNGKDACDFCRHPNHSNHSKQYFVRISRYHGRFIIVHHHFTGCWFQIFCMFTLKIGEDEPIWTITFFKGGWFNHQLADNYYVYIFIYIMTCQALPPWRTPLPSDSTTRCWEHRSVPRRRPPLHRWRWGIQLAPLYRSAKRQRKNMIKVKVDSLKWYLH